MTWSWFGHVETHSGAFQTEEIASLTGLRQQLGKFKEQKRKAREAETHRVGRIGHAEEFGLYSKDIGGF